MELRCAVRCQLAQLGECCSLERGRERNNRRPLRAVVVDRAPLSLRGLALAVVPLVPLDGALELAHLIQTVTGAIEH